MKKKITIPTSWNDVSVREYQYYAASIDKATTIHKAKGHRCHYRVLWFDRGRDAIPDARQAYEDIVARLDWVNSPPEGDVDLVQTFEFEGTEYGFIPNWNKLTFGEFVDLEHYATDGRFVENLDRAMALMYRPITEKAHGHYRIEDYTIDEARVSVMRDMPMTIAVGAMVFFWSIAENFASDSRSSLPPSSNPRANGSLGINGAGTE